MEDDYLEEYNNFRGSAPIPPIEMEKYQLTKKMEEARGRNDFERVIQLAKEIARICRSQGKEFDAYLLDHEAFRYTQKIIYRDAEISIKPFDDVPYVEKLKEAMTKAADQAMAAKQIDFVVCYKRLLARICRIQGKESDAYLLESAVHPMLKQAKVMRQQRGLTEAELESACLRRIAEKYGRSLSEG